MTLDGTPITGNLPVCAFVEKQVLWKGLSREDLDKVFRAGRMLRFAAGQTIIREGEPGDVLFLIFTGSVQVMGQGPQGPLELAQLTRGALFGEVGFLSGKPRTATVVTREATELVAFPRVQLESILDAYPKVRKLIQAMLSARAQDTIQKATGEKASRTRR